MTLNIHQKKILDATLEFLFAECKDLELTDGLHVLKTILGYHLPEAIQTRLHELDMFELVMQIRGIFDHPCPQNCSVGSLVQEEMSDTGLLESFVYYTFNGNLFREQQGLLNLTVKNNSISNINKTDVVNYIKHCIYKQIHQYKQELGLSDFSYYSPEKYWSITEREGCTENRHDFKYPNVNMTIKVNAAQMNKLDTMWKPGLENIIEVSLVVRNEKFIQQIKEELTQHNPVVNKRTRAGSGFAETPIQMTIRRDDNENIGFIIYGFLGQDPALSSFFDIINRHVFNCSLSHTSMNLFKEICGQELQACPEGIDLDDNWPETILVSQTPHI
jgi:hypothetical protein